MSKIKRILLWVGCLIIGFLGVTMIVDGVFPIDVKNVVSQYDKLITGLIRIGIGIPVLLVAIWGIRSLKKSV